MYVTDNERWKGFLHVTDIMLLVFKWANKTLEERSDDCLYCMYNTSFIYILL